MIGVLDLQGGVVEHIDHLVRLGIPCKPIKDPADLKDMAGLIIPGGESTCISRLLHLFGFKDAIMREFQRGMKIWGTCAGAILLAKTIVGEAPYLALIDLDIERNSFGSQLDSFMCEATIPQLSADPLPLIFIRAPKILRVGSDVDILLKIDDYIAAAETPSVMVTVFHPELTGYVEFHRHFARKCGLIPLDEIHMPSIDPGWNETSWTQFCRSVHS